MIVDNVMTVFNLICLIAEPSLMLLPKKKFRLLQQSSNHLPVVMIKPESTDTEGGIIKLTGIINNNQNETIKQAPLTAKVVETETGQSINLQPQTVASTKLPV